MYQILVHGAFITVAMLQRGYFLRHYVCVCNATQVKRTVFLAASRRVMDVTDKAYMYLSSRIYDSMQTPFKVFDSHISALASRTFLKTQCCSCLFSNYHSMPIYLVFDRNKTALSLFNNNTN